MNISYSWLQEHIEEKLPSPEDLREKIIFHAFEVESMENIHDDTIFDIKVLPDRAGDCLSHYGIAREVAGLCALTLKEREIFALPQTPLALPIEVTSEQCRRYIAIQIDGVVVNQSPEWLVKKLESVGQKSINTVVDIANFVMLDSGQPIHVFDRAKIDGGLIVRTAHADEKIITLSDEEKNLRDDSLVIADYLGALAIAGIKGGKTAEVTAATTSIVIEVANFDASSIRRTSRKLGLATDASKRFENNYSPELALAAAQEMVSRILNLTGGEAVGMIDIYPTPQQSAMLEFSYTDISRVLGNSITPDDIEAVFKRYRYGYQKKDDVFTLSVPVWRMDITGAHDIAEEVGRVIGYEKIPSAVLPFQPSIEPNQTERKISAVRAWCIKEGYREVYTYTFRKKGEVHVAYGTKDKSALRANLSDGLKESYELNRLNAPLLGLKEVKLFEIGTVFFADREELHVATIDGGTVQELPLDVFITEKNIDNSNVALPTLPKTPRQFEPWSAYPFITRDIAVWVAGEDRSELTKIVDRFATKHHVPYYQFDEFSKEGRTSLAYRFIFQAPDRTLTDAEVTAKFDELLQEIRAKTPFEIR